MQILIYGFFYIVSIISDRILYFEYINVMSKYSWMVSFIIYPILNFIALSFFVLYSLYNGYQNVRDHKSFAADIALLFCFFTWQRVSRIQYSLTDLVTAIAYEHLARVKEWAAGPDGEGGES